MAPWGRRAAISQLADPVIAVIGGAVLPG